MQPFKTIGLIGRLGSPNAVETLKRLLRFLGTRELDVIVDERTATVLLNHGYPEASRSRLGELCDLVIVVGGDGSLLSAARVLCQTQTPVLGVNRGRLGFLTDISPDDVEERIGEVDVAFTALPHNESQNLLPKLAEANPEVRLVDMAGDFRTNDPAGYEKYYGCEHTASDWLPRFVYGFTEFQREKIRAARLVANPGCFATGMLLALAPLAAAGRLQGNVCLLGLTGSSGSGNKPRQTTHHPERFSNVRSYKPLGHQHLLGFG